MPAHRLVAPRLVAACLLLGLVVACRKDASGPGDGGPGGEDPPTVTVGMTCATASGTTIPCEIQLGSATKFRVTLVSSECRATANVIRLTKPVEASLTADGCHEAAGKFWEFSVPANSVAALEITGGQERASPQLSVQGATSPWTLLYEDGYDTDFNDIVLRIETL